MPQKTGQASHRLRHEAVGPRDVLFQDMTAMAPAVAAAGGDNTLSVFGTEHITVDHPGLTGVFAGSVHAVMAFAGFAAAPLAEGTKDPRHTPHRAVLGGALAIGALYVLTTYAMAVSKLSTPVSYAGPAVGIRLCAGWVVLAVLLKRHPQRMAETARVRFDDNAVSDPFQSGAQLR